MSGKNINKQDDAKLCSFCNKNPIDSERSNVCSACLEEILKDSEVFDC